MYCKKMPNLLFCSFKPIALFILQRKKTSFNRNQYRQPGSDANAVYDYAFIRVVDKQLNKITKYISSSSRITLKTAGQGAISLLVLAFIQLSILTFAMHTH